MNYNLSVAAILTVVLIIYHFGFKPPAEQTPQEVAVIQEQLKTKKILEINLTESLVKRMEKDWNKLPQLAEAKREHRGWRITKVRPDSLFAQAGLQEGDLVTTEFLNKLKTSNTQIQLMLRVQQILNRITR